MHVVGGERMDEGDIPKNVTGLRTDTAAEVPASPGAVGGEGAPAHVGAFFAARISYAANILAQGVSGLIVLGDNEAVQ
jgi:hypothetical protein